jgi:hypothetical protein
MLESFNSLHNSHGTIRSWTVGGLKPGKDKRFFSSFDVQAMSKYHTVIYSVGIDVLSWG